MKSDLERICKVATLGGCECEAEGGWIFFTPGTEEEERVIAIDAVVRPEMLRAFAKVAWEHLRASEDAFAEIEWAASYQTDDAYRHSGDLMYCLGFGILFAEDRIAWVVKNIVELIEETMEGKDEN